MFPGGNFRVLLLAALLIGGSSNPLHAPLIVHRLSGA
jgi:hypothetical protein